MPADQPPEISFEAMCATSVQTGPDGKNWPVLHFNTTIISIGILLTIENAEQMATELPRILNDAAQKAKRANSPLVIATATDTDKA